MGLRKEIKAVLDTKGLDVNQALLKISALVHAEKLKKEKPIGTFEIYKMDAEALGEKKYRIESVGAKPLPESAICALHYALESYSRDVSFCDCAVCEKEAEQLKARGSV